MTIKGGCLPTQVTCYDQDDVGARSVETIKGEGGLQEIHLKSRKYFKIFVDA